jgi:hypothetical protein
MKNRQRLRYIKCPFKKPGLQVTLKSGDGWTGPEVHWQRIQMKFAIGDRYITWSLLRLRSVLDFSNSRLRFTFLIILCNAIYQIALRKISCTFIANNNRIFQLKFRFYLREIAITVIRYYATYVLIL